MLRGGGPGTPTSPWVWSTGGDYLGRSITVTVTYNDTTHALISLVSVRDPGCKWSQLVLGLNAQTKTIAVPAGTTMRTAAQLSAVGFDTVDDIWALQITAQ